MKVMILPCTEPDIERTEPVCLAAIMVYEDAACGARAKTALDRVVSRLPFEGVCSLDLWPFELLDYPLLKLEVAEGAARSAVVALSLHGDQPLPLGVQSWLDLWLSQASREDQAAVAVLMDESQRHAPAAMETVLRLYRACRRGGVALFLGFQNAESAIGQAVKTRLPQNPVPLFPLPTDAVRQLEGLQHSLALR
jgi:hypothetical protein